MGQLEGFINIAGYWAGLVEWDNWKGFLILLATGLFWKGESSILADSTGHVRKMHEFHTKSLFL